MNQSKEFTPNRADTLLLDKCKGCGEVGLVERGEVPFCARCRPNAYAFHLADEAIKRAKRAP